MDETPIATNLRYLRELACFRLPRNFPVFLCNVIGGYKENEPIKISLYISNVLYDHLKYRNSYWALRLGIKVANLVDEATIEAEEPVAPPIVPVKVQVFVIDDFLILVHNWDTNVVMSNYFDYCKF